jgi:hypothetical protein
MHTQASEIGTWNRSRPAMFEDSERSPKQDEIELRRLDLRIKEVELAAKQKDLELKVPQSTINWGILIPLLSAVVVAAFAFVSSTAVVS